ncbi:PKD domain-containing protein [Aurantibacillus circumpalustris]|uniref:PKD domain-containing protein n=1 Tax=Aurantibacillus circumpalustris TaxID=3036359 RepID=UPI00295AB6AB|nr:PKD domain-containing protein [Aurantibacillus circumpalustris]
MKLNIIWILSTSLFFTACHKRKYEDEKVQLKKEDIYMTGYINNEPISLKIGTDGYYCYSSHQQRSDSIYVFEGELKKFDCNPCPTSLKLELSDYRQRLPDESVPIDSSLKIGSRNFIPGMPRINTVRFTAHSNKDVSSITWNLSNGKTSKDAVFSCEFEQQGVHTVSLTVRTKNNCESRVINKIFAGGESGLFVCSVTAELVQNNTSEFKPNITGGKAPYSFIWSFGDGTTSTSSVQTHDYKWAGSYPVKLQIKDAENNTCESNYIHIAGNDNSSCAANMSLSNTGSRNAFLDGVKIQWTDESNMVFKSDNIGQPAESYFEIVKSEAYAANERGETGRLLTLRFNVLLSNGSRKYWFKSDNTALVVTYK